jgi:lipoprotein-anchoring transpeptidase ErfK/SrfK
MKRLIVFCGFAGLMLGTATPPPSAIAPVAPEPVAAEASRTRLPPAPEPQKPIPDAATNLAPALPRSAAPVAYSERRPPPSDGALKIVVSLPQQKAFVYKAGALVAVSSVSTGRRGHETPTGTFPIMEKQVHHRSNRYSNAPMPYMQRLTAYGIALHAGHLPGYPASHGCIRLPWGFAKKLYGMTGYGTTVTVTRGRVKAVA